VTPSVDRAVEALSNGASRVCILTHYRSTACEIARQIEAQGVRVHLVGTLTDAGTVEKRRATIALAKGERCVLVATFHSVGIGIDLTAFSPAIFAELHWSPGKITQAMGRFSRLSGTQPSLVELLAIEGTLDESIAHALTERVADINKVIRAGQSEGELQAALETGITDEEFFARICSVAASREFDEYE